ncbi:GSK-3-binding protein-like [Rhea pennata]|uniref:GSK-3-binding protein-like n=1 Tax=Rhea pennata TaxID=8795 RepID=UPI002E253D04
MPCRPGERFLLLERSVAVGPAGSKEVDALVAKLGEVLQLSAQRAPPPRAPKHLGPGSARDRAAPYSPRCSGGGLLAPRGPAPLPAHHLHQPRAESPRPERGSHQRVTKQLCGRGWLRSAARRRKQPPPGPGEGPEEEEEDPHRLLQQLILSGNLIKEAVRRLQLAAAAAASTACSGGASAGSGGADGEAAARLPLQ